MKGFRRLEICVRIAARPQGACSSIGKNAISPPFLYRNIAQSVEQRADNAEVDGPNPSIPTKSARMAMQPIRRDYSLLRDLERDINKYGPPVEW